MNGLPVPAARLKADIVVLRAGTELHQLYDSAYAAGRFHPGTGPVSHGGLAKPTRFAPIRDRKGKLVPYLYAGESLQCAIFETIFHDVDFTAAAPVVPLSDFGSRAHARLVPQRDLRLVRLHGRALLQLKVTRLLLIESPPRCYPATAAWAQALHRQYDGIDGLVWKSRKLDDQDSYLLFGDRVKAAALAATAMSAALNLDPGLRSAVVQEALAVGVLTV